MDRDLSPPNEIGLGTEELGTQGHLQRSLPQRRLAATLLGYAWGLN